MNYISHQKGCCNMNDKMVKSFNDQIQAEFYSAYMYYSMSLYCEAQNKKGIAHWLKIQYEEEREHAMRLISHLQDRGATVKLMQIDQPPVEFDSILAVFEQALEHEKYVTKRIHDMYALAVKEKDYAAQNHLVWFVDEQVEEEATFTEIVEKMRLIADNPMGMFYMDAELARRAAE